MFSSVSSSLLFITLISTTLLSTLVHSQSSAIGPIPLIGNNSLANPAWTTLFLTGVTIPQIPLKSTTFLSNLLVDANNCGPFSNKWAFGIDDGPSEFSLRHNQYLKANSIPATYFMIGRQIPPLAAYVKSVADDPSFIVAGHTYSHSYLFSLTNENIVGELVWGAKAIYDATGRVPRFMRPPYGSIDERVRAIMVAMDIVPIMWNVDSNDWQLNSYPAYAGFPAVNPSMTPAQVIASWTTLLAQPRSNGVIALQHDVNNMTIAIAESNLIPMAKALPGFTPVSMVECLASQNVGSPYATSGKLYDLLVGPNGTPANSNGVAPADRSLSGQNDNNSVGKNTASSGSKSAYIVGLSIVVLGLILVIL